MYRNKKDVDKHVDNLISKLSVKEFKTRAYSIARLYYEVGDYASCQRYVEQYLTQKDNNAAAYKLLGQALHKLKQKEKALEHYKTSLDIDPTQTSTILDSNIVRMSMRKRVCIVKFVKRLFACALLISRLVKACCFHMENL